MEEFFRALEHGAGTLGPIGVLALGAWYLYLKNPPLRSVSEPTAQSWHIENRDTLRKVDASAARIEVGQEHALELLRQITLHQEKTADALVLLQQMQMQQMPGIVPGIPPPEVELTRRRRRRST